MLETELKFAIHGTFALPSFDSSEGGVFEVKEMPSQELNASYFDTEDLRLARSGITLRYRTGEGPEAAWHLKLPVGKKTASREELPFAGIESIVPEQAQDLVFAFTRGLKLGNVATISTRRRRWLLMGEEGAELAELVQDDVSVLEGGDVVGRFTELELEKRSVDIDGLGDIADVLRRAGALSAEPIPKAVRAIGPRATAPPDVPPPPETGPDKPAGNAVAAALLASVDRLLRNDPHARRVDPEGVHQVRVAARRLRSDLGTFAPLLEGEWAPRLEPELRWLGDVLGEVRDLDVLRDRLIDSSGDLESDLRPLFAELQARHEVATGKMLVALRSDRYRTLLDRLIVVANKPGLDEAADQPSGKVLPSLVEKAWKRLAKRARKLDLDDDESKFHKVRIRAKRVRYASEAVQASLGSDAAKKAGAFASYAESIQDTLGAHQDAIVAKEVISEVALASGDARLALASGRLIERQYEDATAVRVKFFDVWRDFDRKKNRSWLTP
jgi:CHAD domain-containing protein